MTKPAKKDAANVDAGESPRADANAIERRAAELRPFFVAGGRPDHERLLRFAALQSLQIEVMEQSLAVKSEQVEFLARLRALDSREMDRLRYDRADRVELLIANAARDAGRAQSRLGGKVSKRPDLTVPGLLAHRAVFEAKHGSVRGWQSAAALDFETTTKTIREKLKGQIFR